MPAAPHKPSWSRVSGLVLGGLLVLGVALRLSGRGFQSLWFDEAMSVSIARSEDWLGLLAHDRNPPLFFELLRRWSALGFDGEAGLRLLTALVSCGTLFLFAALVRVLRAPLLAVAVFAVSPFSIWIAQELRGYVLLEASAVLVFLGLALSWCPPERPRLGPFLVALGCAGAFGAHYMGCLLGATVLALAIAAYLAGTPKERAVTPVLAAAGGFAVWIPWLVNMLPSQLESGWAETLRASPRDLAELPVRFFLVEADAIPSEWRWAGYALGGLLLAGLCAGLFVALRRRERIATAALLALAAPVLGALAIALIVTPSLAPRYLTVAEPAAVLLLASGLVALRPRSARVAIAGALLAGLLGLVALHKTTELKEDFRGACTTLRANWTAGDIVTCITGTFPVSSEAPLEFYLRARPDAWEAVVHEADLEARLGKLPPGTRVHVVYRDAPYAAPRLQRFRAALELVDAPPPSRRVRYLLFEKAF